MVSIIFSVIAAPVLEISNGDLTCTNGEYYSWSINGEYMYKLYLPLNGNTMDYSGYNNNLETDYNQVYVDGVGVTGGALVYDQSEDYAYIKDSDLFDFFNTFSVEAWIFLEDKNYSTNERMILSKMKGTHDVGQFSFGVSDQDTLMVRLWDENGKMQAFYSGVQIPLEQWVHVAVVYDNGDSLKFYKNGVMEQELTNGYDINNQLKDLYVHTLFNQEYDNDAIYVGNWQGGAEFNFLGRIDNIIVYDGVLSDNLLLKHANQFYDVITEDMTMHGQNWKCYSGGVGSNEHFLDNLPILTNIELKGNSDADNLICDATGIIDQDNDSIQEIYNFFKNGQGLMVLNTPLEDLKAQDYSGYQNNGVVYNGELVNDRNGFEAVSFSETSYIKIEDDASLDLTKYFTIEAWVKLGAKSHYLERMITSKWDSTDRIGQYTFGVAEANTLMVRLMDTNGIYSAYYSGVNIPLDQWTHVAIVYDSGKLKFYKNGVMEQEIVTNVTDIYNQEYNNDDLYLGNWVYFEDGFNFVGALDDIKIYNLALTDEDMQNHYNNNYNQVSDALTSNGDSWVCSVDLYDGFGSNNYVSENILIGSNTQSVSLLSTNSDNSNSNSLDTSNDGAEDWTFASNEETTIINENDDTAVKELLKEEVVDSGKETQVQNSNEDMEGITAATIGANGKWSFGVFIVLIIILVGMFGYLLFIKYKN